MNKDNNQEYRERSFDRHHRTGSSIYHLARHVDNLAKFTRFMEALTPQVIENSSFTMPAAPVIKKHLQRLMELRCRIPLKQELTKPGMM